MSELMSEVACPNCDVMHRKPNDQIKNGEAECAVCGYDGAWI